MEVSGELTGLDQIQAKLKALGEEAQYKGARTGMRKAANLVRDAVRTAAKSFDDPETAEDIGKNIAVRFSRKAYKRDGSIHFRVGVLGGAKAPAKAVGEFAGKGKANPGGDTFYWRFLEFGTENIPAQPFMRPALQNNQSQATQTFITEFDKAIARAIKRQAK